MAEEAEAVMEVSHVPHVRLQYFATRGSLHRVLSRSHHCWVRRLAHCRVGVEAGAGETRAAIMNRGVIVLRARHDEKVADGRFQRFCNCLSVL